MTWGGFAKNREQVLTTLRHIADQEAEVEYDADWIDQAPTKAA